MGDMLEEAKVLSDAKENRYSTKTRCEEVEKIDSQSKEVLQNKFINPCHDSLVLDNINKLMASHQLNESLSDEIVNTSVRQGRISEERHSEQDKSAKKSPQAKNSEESSQRDKNPTTNGSALSMEHNSLNFIAYMNKQKCKEARHSGKRLSDEDSLSHISESISGELNTNGIGADSRSRKDDVSSSSTRREHTVVQKGSSEFKSLSRGSVSEKEQPKKKISFRALVRMKGLGRKLRTKKQHGKSKQKHINNKTDSNNRDLFFSDYSAKYLLESSTSATDEQSVYKRTSKDEELNPHVMNSEKSSSFSGTSTTIFQNLDSSSTEHLCTSEYLDKRRYAVCEELEKTIICGGEQTLAELRSILVIQHKLTGFGLL